MRRAADADNEEAEAGGRECRADEIEGVDGPRCRRQGFQPDCQRDQAERKIDGKQPGPGPKRQYAGCNRRSEGECGRDHQRVVAEAAAQQAAWIDEAD
jgi:hypothetical protein